jgi:hypothetical protein
LELSFDRPETTVQRRGDFLVGVTLQAKKGDYSEGFVVQISEQAPDLVSDRSCELGAGLFIGDLGQDVCAGGVHSQVRTGDDAPASSLDLPFVTSTVGGLSRRDREQQLPELVAICKFGKSIFRYATKEAVKSAEGDILTVGRAGSGGPEPRLSQSRELLKVSLPKQSSGLVAIAGLHFPDPATD